MTKVLAGVPGGTGLWLSAWGWHRTPLLAGVLTCLHSFDPGALTAVKKQLPQAPVLPESGIRRREMAALLTAAVILKCGWWLPGLSCSCSGVVRRRRMPIACEEPVLPAHSSHHSTIPPAPALQGRTGSAKVQMSLLISSHVHGFVSLIQFLPVASDLLRASFPIQAQMQQGYPRALQHPQRLLWGCTHL